MKTSLWLALLATCSCAPSSPKYATSLVPPQAAHNQRPREPSPTKLRLIPSREKAEDATRAFFLYLSIGDLEKLLETLDAKATVNRNGSSTHLPAAATLVDLYAELSRPATGAGNDRSTRPFFSPIRIVSVKQNLNTTLVSVLVTSPEEVHGNWTLALTHREADLPVSVITLPEKR